MAESCNEILCSLIVEISLVGCRTVSEKKRNNFKNCRIILGRNEFNDIILQIRNELINTKYAVRDIVIHRRFMKDGKATILLKDLSVTLFLSNCPPSRLLLFLRTLATKYKIQKMNATIITNKKRLLSDRRKLFEEISPINNKDMEIAFPNSGFEKRKNVIDKETSCNTYFLSPVSSKLQRMEDKENVCESFKVRRKSFNPLRSSVKLTVEQEHVLSAVLSGSNVFFTGKAGTGKSFLLQRIVGALPPDRTFVTASTGVAASHIGGVTLHSFAGIGSGTAPLDQCIQLARRKNAMHQWKTCRHLIVDEISMVEGEFFEKLETVARVVRDDERPFGGIQLIVCGDFLQLPPVSKEAQKKFCFQTSAWKKSIDISIVLNQVKRQSDAKFVKLLEHIRVGCCSDEHEEILRDTRKNKLENNGIQATKLCTHKEDVDYTNSVRLKRLSGDSECYAADDSDPQLSKFMDKNCLIPRTVELKNGAQVMLLKNLDVQKCLVNGSRGVVVGFETNNKRFPIVRFVDGTTLTVKIEKFIVKANGINLIRRQVPLTLAWAISIHKSQGMTLDCVEMSLSRVFECGQAYVALSRARSLQGLRVLDFDKRCVRANPDVLNFYVKLKRLRPILESITR